MRLYCQDRPPLLPSPPPLGRSVEMQKLLMPFFGRLVRRTKVYCCAKKYVPNQASTITACVYTTPPATEQPHFPRRKKLPASPWGVYPSVIERGGKRSVVPRRLIWAFGSGKGACPGFGLCFLGVSPRDVHHLMCTFTSTPISRMVYVGIVGL